MEHDTHDAADIADQPATETAEGEHEVVDEQLIEEISIDGMCGVY